MVNLVDVTYKDQPIPDGSLYAYQDYGYDARGNYYRANAWFLTRNKTKIRFEMFKGPLLNYAYDYALAHNIQTIYIQHAVEGR